MHRWLHPGDVVEMEIEHLGVLRNTLVGEQEETLTMPMPTPAEAWRRAHRRSQLYRYHLRRLITWYLEALDQLPPEAFSWQPPSDLANSLAAICVHAISSGEWWVLSCVGEGPLERDRDAEFAAARRLLAGAAPALHCLPRPRRSPARAYDHKRLRAPSAGIPAGDRMNRRCLTHTIEHLGLHLGHVEITIDWWKTAGAS